MRGLTPHKFEILSTAIVRNYVAAPVEFPTLAELRIEGRIRPAAPVRLPNGNVYPRDEVTPLGEEAIRLHQLLLNLGILP